MTGTPRQTHCVLDTLLLAGLEGASASVRSVSPLSGDVVRLEIGRHGVTAEPRSAVVSFGLRNDEGENAFETLCPYVNAFPSDAEYQRWIKATDSVDDDWVKEATTKGADGKKLLEAARALLNQYDK